MPKGETLWKAAWEKLRESVVFYRGRPIGTVAARDPGGESLNYDQVFFRDFAVSALAFLMNGEPEIVRNFLVESIALQNRAVHMGCHMPGRGLMPASFKVVKEKGREGLAADFGEKAIAKVAPVDSGLWWLVVLRAYVKATGDRDLPERPECQSAMRLILDLCLTARFEMFPTLLVPDGSFMIDRRMGVYGHPIEVQALFFAALRAAGELLADDGDCRPYLDAVRERLGHLLYHIRTNFWLDFNRLNEIYRFKVEEYSATAANKFNVYPESIPAWLYGWVHETGGYFVGNLGPGRIDFRFFAMGNLLAITSSLADREQAASIVRLIEMNWDDLVGAMPMKLCFPALEGSEWRALTGCDAKNSPWSYHNGGSWPFLLWPLAAAALKTNARDLAAKALDIAERRLMVDNWPEYYDGRDNRLIGRKARERQTWTVAGYIVARSLMKDRNALRLVSFDDDLEVTECGLGY